MGTKNHLINRHGYDNDSPTNPSRETLEIIEMALSEMTFEEKLRSNYYRGTAKPKLPRPPQLVVFTPTVEDLAAYTAKLAEYATKKESYDGELAAFYTQGKALEQQFKADLFEEFGLDTPVIGVTVNENAFRFAQSQGGGHQETAKLFEELMEYMRLGL